MKIFKSLRSLIGQAQKEGLPTSIYAILVNDVYSVLGAFAIGACTATLVGSIAAWRTNNLLLTILTISTAAVAVVRVSITISYRGHKSTIGDDLGALRRWERWYAIGAATYGACLGAMCFVALLLTDDSVSHLLLISNAVGFAAGTTARNSSRPSIAIAQVSFILLPIVIGSALHLGVAYAVLSAIAALYYLATIEIAQYLGRNRRDLLLMTRSKAELAQSLDTALANMSHGLCMFDRHLRLLVWNTRFCEIYGIEPEALSAGLPLSQVIELSASRSNQPNRTAAEMTAEFGARMARGVLSHWKRELPGGRIIALSHQPMAEGGAVVIFEDVTERDQAEARARFFATHDGLTGLPNRLTFGQAVSDAVKVGRRNGQEFAVMFIDLDRFKCINDTLGHAAGDTLLTEIANRLKHCLEGNDVVARVGGDEFVILLREVPSTQRVTAVARKLLSAIVILRRALERDELLLYYQPKRDLIRGGISGVEALLRWRHPDLGLLQPTRFIPLAEETGLIVPIGKWVLKTACAQNMAWQRQGLPPLRIAVNLSPRQFADPSLLHDIRAALERSGMAATLLELEITESMVMQNVERAVRVLQAIKRLGVILAIDDFGTGYSSMSLVKKFPIDVLKIDRSFVREVTRDSGDRAIADAIIALGRALDLTIVAEGVETAEQEAFLRAHNCDEVQGYLISKPMPPDEFAAFLATQSFAELKAKAG
jgi:diguanylate cyclase (GGDEF)-like protein